jgi:RecA-family ATPase
VEPQSLTNFLSWKPPNLTPIIDKGILYEGSKAILYGRYKSLKSMIALDFSMKLMQGKPWIGFKTPEEGQTVLHLQLEIAHPLLHKRVVPMARETTPKKDVYFWTEHYMKLDDSVGFNQLHEQLEKIRPNVLVIDPVYKIIKGNPLDAHAVQLLFDNLDKLIAEYNLAILLISHTRKGAYDDPLSGSDDLLGSVLYSAWADSIIKVERKAHGLLEVKFEVIRHAEEEINSVMVKMDENLQFAPVPINLLESLKP